MNVEFVESIPPVRKSGPRPKFADFANVLRDNPGRWAKLPAQYTSNSSAVSTAWRIRNGGVSSFAEGEFDSSARECVVYVRYVGTGVRA